MHWVWNSEQSIYFQTALFSEISTTRLAGGLLCAYKARVTGQARKGPLNERSPSAPLSLAQALARAFVICCPCLLAHP